MCAMFSPRVFVDVKIALITSTVPFVLGGARNIVDWLAIALERAGHRVEKVEVPFDEEPERIVSQMAMFRMIDLTDRADLVVCFRPPAYLVQHPRKVLWFIHHIRPYYDLWDTEYRGFADTLVSRARRDLIRRVDDRALAEAAHVFTNSVVVSERLAEFNHVESEVLYPPLHDSESFVDLGQGNEIVAVSRLEHHKRQHLLVEALALTSSPVELRLIGKGSSPAYANSLRDRAEALGVVGRLHIDDTWLAEGDKRRFIGRALAGAYIPLDEDSYGYPSLEYAHAKKAILTTKDAGGVLELVQDGSSGVVVDPVPESLASAMDQLFLDRPYAEELGRNARARIDQMEISWQHVVERITAV